MGDTTMTCIELGGTGVGDYDLINGAGGFELAGSAFLDGDLEVSFIDGFMPTELDEFFFIQGFDIVGTFDNTGGGLDFASSGSLNVAGGVFQVEYGTDFVRLHSFQAIPEPTAVAVLAMVVMAGMTRRRRV